MRNNNGLFKSATKFLPTFHGQYREMCSLAAVGQLGGPQMCELNEHIARCVDCRKYLESVAQASVQVLPVLAEEHFPVADIAPPSGMRARFLQRLAEEPKSEKGSGVEATKIGLRLQLLARHLKPNGRGTAFDEEPLDPDEELVFQRLVPKKAEKDPIPSSRRASLRLWPTAAAIAATALIGMGGFYLGHRTLRPTTVATTNLTPAVLPGSGPIIPARDFDRIHELEKEKAALEAQLGELKGQLSVSGDQQKELSSKLAEANDKLASLVAQQAKLQGTANGAQEEGVQIASLQKEVTRLRTEFDESIFKITAQQHENDELRSKLETTEANLQQESNLKDAKSQMGELVAARNLHIVDVYDADPSGKRQRAFGRVFYTEGKSLVFYAYDLEGAGQMKANVVFHVWGGKAGVKEVTHSLGVLRKDDAGQARWAMTFDDPNVLSQINSVFVTAEASNKHYDEPHGKKVLFAYFGSQPNHP
jgi:hypothetical protein